jgi:phage FluMu protein Com
MFGHAIRLVECWLRLGAAGSKCPRCHAGTLCEVEFEDFLGTVEMAGGPEAGTSVSFKGAPRDEYLVATETKCPSCGYVSTRNERRHLRRHA